MVLYTDDASYLTQKYCDTRGLNGMQNIPYIDAVFDKRLELGTYRNRLQGGTEAQRRSEPCFMYTQKSVYQGIKTHEDE